MINHLDTFSIFDLEATSLALTHDPVTCYLDWSIDQASDPLIVPFFEITKTASGSGTIQITIPETTQIATYTFVISGVYPGFEQFDPYATTQQTITLEIRGECPRATSFEPTVTDQQVHLYVIGEPALELAHSFLLGPDTNACYDNVQIVPIYEVDNKAWVSSDPDRDPDCILKQSTPFATLIDSSISADDQLLINRILTIRVKV